MTQTASRAPTRIQRKRTKGWAMPEGAVYVGRPTKWGNPHRWSDYRAIAYTIEGEPFDVHPASRRRFAVVDFESDLMCGHNPDYPSVDMIRHELAGKDLVCWCPPDHPCHADVLLKVANAALVDYQAPGEKP